MRERTVNHQQASQLLHNKFVAVVGDSIQRSVYKDLVMLLQKDNYLSSNQLRTKGELSFELDCLKEGGCLSKMTNGTEYKEVRQFQSDHHMVRFYFVTRVFSGYMQSILEDFKQGLRPDILIINSCVWDISRYDMTWADNYKENLHKFLTEIKKILPEETLVVWNTTMPLSNTIKGGFLVPEIEYKVPQLRHDVIEANFYSGTLADAYGIDVLDLHFQFRFSLQHRARDGVHWNAVAHRRITSLLLQHIAQAWGVMLLCPPNLTPNVAVNYLCPGDYFFNGGLPHGYLSFNNVEPQPSFQENAENLRPAVHPELLPPPRKHPYKRKMFRSGVDYRPPHYIQPTDHHLHEFETRSQLRRHYYAPYARPRPTYPPKYYY